MLLPFGIWLSCLFTGVGIWLLCLFTGVSSRHGRRQAIQKGTGADAAHFACTRRHIEHVGCLTDLDEADGKCYISSL
jgi:hypothetical protein